MGSPHLCAQRTQPEVLVLRAVDNILLNGGHHFETFEQARRCLVDHATIRGETPQGLWRG